MTGAQRLALVVLVPLVVVAALVIGRSLGDRGPDPTQLARASDRATFEYEFEIPEGTAARIAAGDEVQIVPRELVVRVGEAIRIVNDDVRPHLVGVFYVGAGETLTQQFTAEGERSAACTVHPSGQFTLRIEA